MVLLFPEELASRRFFQLLEGRIMQKIGHGPIHCGEHVKYYFQFFLWTPPMSVRFLGRRLRGR